MRHFLLKIFLTVLASFMALSILHTAIRYFNPTFGRGFLVGKESFFYGHYQLALLTHGISASIAIFIAGWMMFLKKGGKGHQFFGKVYVGFVLFLATPSAVYIAFYAIGGWLSTLAFILLAIAWFASTLLAVRTEHHGYWIRMSFLLACSAYFLRTILLFSPLVPMDFDQFYILTAWLCWLPGLVIYVLYQKIRRNSIVKA